MKLRKFNIGPGAASLILIVVVLCLSTLGVLSLRSAQDDLNLSRRSIEVIEWIYELNDAAEQRLAQLDHVLAACGQDAATEQEYLSKVQAQLPQA